MIPTFIRAYPASAEVAGHRIVTFSAAATTNTVAVAGGGTVALVGVSDRMGADAGGMCDVHRGGLVAIQLGGTVVAGDPLTANASGLAIKAVPGAGANLNIIGFADQPGVRAPPHARAIEPRRVFRRITSSRLRRTRGDRPSSAGLLRDLTSAAPHARG